MKKIINKHLPTLTFAAIFGLIILSSASRVTAAADNIVPEPSATPIQQSSAALLDGFKRGVCYSGFRHGQHPDRGSGAVNPSDKEILEDLQILSQQGNFGLIRLYDSGANSESVLRLIQTNQLHLKVLLGAWLDAETNNPGCSWIKTPYTAEVLAKNHRSNAAEIKNLIRLAHQYPDIIGAVAVGNETQVDWTDHLVPTESLIQYVRKVKRSVHQPVTVCDNYNWWSHHGAALAKELDFVSVHTYPIWEKKDIDAALPFTIANLQAVRDTLPHSRLVITEAGWATVASEFGPLAREDKQKRYYHDLYAWTDKMNITTFFFEAFDEDWKGDPNDPLGAEKHWGLFTTDRQPKEVLRH